MCFGAMSFNKNLIADVEDLSKLSSDTCAEIVRTGHVIPSDRVPELFYNESFKVQLTAFLKNKGFIVETDNPCKNVLPYNMYYKSKADIVIKSSEYSSTILTVSEAVETPP